VTEAVSMIPHNNQSAVTPILLVVVLDTWPSNLEWLHITLYETSGCFNNGALVSGGLWAFEKVIKN
jgi:hypothetical protein